MGAIATAVSAIAGMLTKEGSIFQNPFVKLLAGIGLQLGASKLAKKKQKKASSGGGTKLEAQIGGSQPREIGSGLFATAGQDISTPFTFGKENRMAVKVIMLSDFRIDGINRVAINNIWCDLTGDNNSERGYGVTGETSAFVRIKLYQGDANQQADPYLVNNTNGKWTDKCRGAGLAYVVVSIEYDKEKMTQIPTFLFECRGVSYDPRYDSSVGGQGSQRYDDASTWAYSDNPIVQAYTYCRGFKINGELIAGKNMLARDLPLQSWIAAMNVCDEIIPAENDQKRYRAGTIFSAARETEHKENLQPLLDACAGELIERVDGDVPMVGMTQPIVATLSDMDIIADEEVTYSAHRSRSELINAVYGSYNDPEKTWNSVAYPAQISEAAQAADGESHATQIDYQAVFSAQQAARLAKAALRANRYQASATIVVRPRWLVLEAGDWINLTLKAFGTRTYRIIARSLAPLSENGARNVTLTLQEVGAGIYDNSVDIPEMPVINYPIVPTLQQFPDGLKVIATQAEGNGSRKIPAIIVSWLPPTDTITVMGVLIELWKTSEPDRKIQFQVRQPQNSYTIVGGLLPHEAYCIRTTVIPEPYRMTLWSDTKTVTTLAENYDNEELKKYVSDMNQWAAFDQRYVKQEIEKVSAVIADATAGGYEIGRSLKRELIVTIDNSRAEYKELISVAVSKTSALAVKLENLEAEVNGNIAQAFNELKTSVETVDGKITSTSKSVLSLNSKVDGISNNLDGLSSRVDQNARAVSESITSINAQYGDLVSNITVRMEAVAAPDGMQARGGFTMKTGSGDNWSTAAFYIDTKPGWSRMLVVANQFLITDSSLSQQPFSFQNGQLTLQAANIGDVTAGYIHSPDNKFIIDLYQQRISIGD